MLAQPTDASGSLTWAPRPGEQVILRLDPQSAGLSVRITSRPVTAAHETRLEKLARTPTVWGTALAALAGLVLVSTAFATGTVRPAPPRGPTPRPGEPTPTPDTRPKLSIGGFVLQPPLQATPVPPSVAPAEIQDPAVQAPLPTEGADVPDTTTVDEDVQPTPEPCTNLLGIGCGAPAPPPLPIAPRRALRPSLPSQLSNVGQPVIPVASPAALDDPGSDDLQAASPGPPRGSSLEAALQAASIADDNFAREVEPDGRAGSGSGK